MYYIAADKYGWKTLKVVESYLVKRAVVFENLGVSKEGQDMKLEDFVPRVAKKVLMDPKVNKGLLICGTGIGVTVGANRFKGIRACLATNEQQAQWSRQFDDCNILCLAGWETDYDLIEKILKKWFETEYDGDKERLDMFNIFDTW